MFWKRKNPTERLVEMLASNPTERLIEMLEQRGQYKHARERIWERHKEIIAALGCKKDARAITALKEVLRQKEMSYRHFTPEQIECARVSLVKIGTPESITALWEVADEEWDQKKRWADAQAASAAGYRPTTASERLKLALAVGDYNAASREGDPGEKALIVEMERLEDINLRARKIGDFNDVGGREREAERDTRIATVLRVLCERPSPAAIEAIGKRGRNVYVFFDALLSIDPSKWVVVATERMGGTPSQVETLRTRLEDVLRTASSRISDEALSSVINLKDVIGQAPGEHSEFLDRWVEGESRLVSMEEVRALASNILRSRQAIA